MGQQQEGVERLACMGMEGMITRGLAVITGAGGLITDWQGRALDGNSDGRVVAAGDARLHAEALAVLQAR